MKPAAVHRPRGNDRGAITPLAAVTLTVLIGIAGLVTDVGVWYVQRRSLQAATDSAAMAAVNHTTTASTTAGAMLARNGFTAANLTSTEVGYYCPDSSLAPAARFSTTTCAVGVVTPSEPNAVRVKTSTTGPRILTGVLKANWAGPAIQSTSVAARIDEAGLTIGSGALAVDLPVANAVLQSMLGGSGLNLTAVQYNGLLNANLNALTFFNALATNLGVSAGNYGSLLATNAKLTDVLQAQIDALNAQGSVTDVTAAVAGLQAIKSKVTGSPSINLGSLFDLGVWKNAPIGSSGAPAALSAGLNAYQLATFGLQLANGQHAAAIPVSGLSIPGLASATVEATAIEPPVHAYFAFGPKGISVHTAQVRVKINISAAGLVTFPLYVEVASGDASISNIYCGADPATDAQVTVRANSGLATLYLGVAPSNAMTNFSSPIAYSDLTAAPLIAVTPLQLVAVNGKAKSSVVASAPTDLLFVQPPASGVVPALPSGVQGYIARQAATLGLSTSPGEAAEVVGNPALSSLTSGLWDNLSLTACILNCTLQVAVPSALTTTLNSVLKPLLQGLDPLTNGILEALGVKLGRAEVTVTGVRCGVPTLVQ